MKSISVVILTKNEGRCIANAIETAFQISDDVWIIDSGSTDNTLEIAGIYQVNVLNIEWKGFGNARNSGAENCKYNWIFCLDADETISEELAHSIEEEKLKEDTIYGFQRRNFWNEKPIRFGEWGHDIVYRLYDKRQAAWNLDEVHEQLVSATQKRRILKGFLYHYTSENLLDYQQKLERYASLSAIKYFKKGKNAGWLKRKISPPFSFIKNYFFSLGFLDGKEGWIIAKAHAHYTNMKYKNLNKLYKKAVRTQIE